MEQEEFLARLRKRARKNKIRKWFWNIVFAPLFLLLPLVKPVLAFIDFLINLRKKFFPKKPEG